VPADLKEILQKFFRPRRVAVVGASRDSRAVGYRVVESLMEAHFQGAIYPVNPKAEQIRGIPAYPSVKALPHLWRRKG
jgi:acetyltransferase